MDLVDPLSEPCAVCGDKSTGTHYGCQSCNGCKGFFRRTILRSQRFTCRFERKCVIDKNFRCACRACRFEKCLDAGMKRDAIQFERDSAGQPLPPSRKRARSEEEGVCSEVGVSSGRQSANTTSTIGTSIASTHAEVIGTLMEMEARVNQEMSLRYRNSHLLTQSDPGSLVGGVDGQEAMPTGGSAFVHPMRSCTVDELNEISRTTLLLMVEWAKNVAPFPDLLMEDKIILLKNYAPQHLILMPAFRSPDTTRICLFNSSLGMASNDSRGGSELNGFSAFKTSNITPRVLDEIVWPMRQLNMKEPEFVCLKALAFLHPEAKGLSQSSQTLVREARNKVLRALYAYILVENPGEAPTRYGNILLLAPALKALTQLLIENATVKNMTLTKFFGLAEVDSLLSEFILDDINGQSTPSVSIKEHLDAPSHFPPMPASNTTSTADNFIAGARVAVSKKRHSGSVDRAL